MSGNSEKVHRNKKYRPNVWPFSLAVWLIVYYAPGLALGRLWNASAGLLWMGLGAVLFSFFLRRSFRPRRLVVDRDGFRIERDYRSLLRGLFKRRQRPEGRGALSEQRRETLFSLGYGKIHEARWVAKPSALRRALGPLLFIEPVWPAQRQGDDELVISHAGDPLVLREDEFAELEDFVETLRGKNILGLARRPTRRVTQPPGPPG